MSGRPRIHGRSDGRDPIENDVSTATLRTGSTLPAGDESFAPRGVFRDVFQSVARHLRLVAAIPLVIAFVVGVYALTRPHLYTATTSFVAQNATGTAGAGALGGVAAQLGVRIPGMGGQSPQFYADLLDSHKLLESVVASPFAVGAPQYQARGPLWTIWSVQAPTPAQRVEATIGALRHSTHIIVAPETGIVTVRVSTQWPTLSLAIAQRYVDLLNAFNLQTRQSQATAERRFAEGRVADLGAELATAEGRLQAFLTENRRYDAPDLVATYQRLQRDVMLRQQLYTAMMQTYEQAKVDEVRDTPVITVVEPAYVNPIPDSRGVIRAVATALVVGLVLAVVAALLLDLRSTRRPARDARERDVHG